MRTERALDVIFAAKNMRIESPACEEFSFLALKARFKAF
jgi:hypothetical protein